MVEAERAEKLFEERKYDEALEICKNIVEKEPDSIRVLNMLSAIYINKKDYSKAREYLFDSLKIDSRNAQTNFYLGLSYFIHEPKMAKEYFEKAIALNKSHAPSYQMLGSYFVNKRDFVFAEKNYLLAKKLAQNNLSIDYDLALLYLRMKDYEKGFSFYRARYNPAFSKSVHSKLITNKNLLQRGMSVKGKRVLITSEQGSGDYIQFIRFLPTLESGNTLSITLKVPKPLKKLIKYNYPFAKFLDESSATIDYHFPVTEFAYLIGLRSDNIPYNDGYISVDDSDSKTFFKISFKSTSKRKIGVIYKGSPYHANDHNRSMKLNDFLHMIKPFKDKFDFYSLQYEPSESEKQTLRERGIMQFKGIENFYDTALAIDNLDYVITVDTSVAHLSGAMGKSTMLLLPYNQDWRWGHEGESTEWYKSVTIFRQHKLGCWGGAFCDLRESLKKLV